MLFERVLFSFLAVDFLLSLCRFAVAQQRILYSRDQLIGLKPANMAVRSPDIPEEIWRKTHRGCRGKNNQRKRKSKWRQRRLEERRYKPCLPLVVMGNVRSLANKMEELTELARSQREYRECSLMCFMETWLHQDIPIDNVSIPGFETRQGLHRER